MKFINTFFVAVTLMGVVACAPEQGAVIKKRGK